MFPKSLIRKRVFPQALDLPWQLDRALENVFGHGAGAREGPWSPPLDIRESEDASSRKMSR